MTQQDPISHLVTLAQLDIDAARAYVQAVDAIDIPSIRDRLDDFRQDHERHVRELSEVIRWMGGEPPERAPDVKGFFIAGYTAIRSTMGIAGALRAMKTNEMMTNAIYERALAIDLPDDVRGLIERNREDERRHLAYIESVLEDRAWQYDGGRSRMLPDAGQLFPLAVGGFLVANALVRRTAGAIAGGLVGAALLAVATQSGVNPGGYLPRSTGPRSAAGARRGRDAVERAREGWEQGHAGTNPPAPSAAARHGIGGTLH
ncbi:MAG TPA: DUF2383 domain-containing protein [Stellaceae bacterium]|jgi:rubrerythrin